MTVITVTQPSKTRIKISLEIADKTKSHLGLTVDSTKPRAMQIGSVELRLTKVLSISDCCSRNYKTRKPNGLRTFTEFNNLQQYFSSFLHTDIH